MLNCDVDGTSARRSPSTVPASRKLRRKRSPKGFGPSFRGTLVTALERDELLRALGEVIDGLLREAEEVHELAAKVGPQLRQFA